MFVGNFVLQIFLEIVFVFVVLSAGSFNSRSVLLRRRMKIIWMLARHSDWFEL